MKAPYYQKDGITLYHGDCLEILPTLPKVDAVITDPPYLIGGNSIGNSNSKSGTWADLNNSAFWFSTWYRLSWGKLIVNKGHFATFCNWRTQPLVICAMAAAGMSATSCLIWDKDWIGPAYKNALRPTYEMVIISSMSEAEIKDRCLSDIWRVRWMAAHSADSIHPAEKPVVLLRKLSNALTTEENIILDPFMGSGTTGIACVRSGRQFIGIEIEEKYCEIAAKRIAMEQSQGRMEFRSSHPAS